MLQLSRLLGDDGAAELFVKLEAFNPGGSVGGTWIGVGNDRGGRERGPDRAGSDHRRRGTTSGNTGIALAFICAAKGYDLVLTLPQGMSRERERLLALYGARFEITESLGGMNEAVAAARRMAARDDVFLPDQFSNPANPEAHRQTRRRQSCGTRSTARSTSCLVAGVGTGGTITGVGEFLKARSPTFRPRGRRRARRVGGPLRRAPRPTPGSRGNRSGLRPAGAQSRRDRRGDRRSATTTRSGPRTALSAREGVLAGISAGAAVHGAIEIAKRPEFATAHGSRRSCPTRASGTSRWRGSSPTLTSARTPVDTL